jgi:chemotaxis protein MotA
MNWTTLIGVIGFWTVIIVAMALAYSVGAFIDVVSLVIVFGGTITAIIFSYEGVILKQFGSSVGQAFKPTFVDYAGVIRRVIEVSLEFKKGGAEALENTIIPNEEDEFLKELLKAVANDMSPEDMEEIFDLELEAFFERHSENQKMIDDVGGIAGSSGMIGTLIGLVAMLLNMSDPSAIGPAMAVALLTTLYGAVLGTGFSAPIKSKLEAKSKIQKRTEELKLRGMLYLLKGDNPRVIEQKLFASIPKNQRESFWA